MVRDKRQKSCYKLVDNFIPDQKYSLWMSNCLAAIERTTERRTTEKSNRTNWHPFSERTVREREYNIKYVQHLWKIALPTNNLAWKPKFDKQLRRLEPKI